MNRFWSESVKAPLPGHSTRRRLVLLALLGLLLAVAAPRQHAEWVNSLAHEQSGQSSANDQEMAANHHCGDHGTPAGGSGLGCGCLHGLCGGLTALPGHQALSARVRIANFSPALQRTVPLPAHGRPPFRPPIS
ncbi:MAG TPA: hypothetical protein PLO60_09345 [Pseudomonadales bacterium]|nr:hypothetical protein [Pseudomonadales bacterium]HNH71788.1 hypothetical protein [Pseudomonadales bacterium]